MVYNLTLVIRSSLKEGERKKFVEAIKSELAKAKITEREWGQKALEYPIKKEVSGFFLNWNIEADEVIPGDFEKKLLGEDNILRHLLLRSR